MKLTPDMAAARVQKGAFKPHIYLSNLCMSFFQDGKNFVSGRMFPIVPVMTSSAHYYEFDRGDLARDNMTRKPEFGHVAPSIFGKREHFYHCEVDQIIIGIDQISTLDFARAPTPALIDPRRAKVRTIAEQMKIHLDRKWAAAYFNPASWNSVYTGTGGTPSGNQFYHFDSANSDPVQFFNALRIKMLQQGLREPNKACIGLNVFAALQTNAAILDRIKYQGSEANPAGVTENVLAQLFHLDEIVVGKGVYNAAPMGAPDDMRFICNPDGVLLCYAANAPSIEEPSAGYTFTWDMLGNGQYTALQQYMGEESTHTEWIEGLLCADPEVTCKDLGLYLQGAASPGFAA